MNNKLKGLKIFVIFMIVIFMVSLNVFAQDQSGGTDQTAEQKQEDTGMAAMQAKVTLPIGDVLIDNTDDNIENFVPAEIDMPVYANTEIRTGEESSCEIELEDGTVIKVGENSDFIVNEILKSITEKPKKRSLFSLLKGKVRSIVSKLKGKDSSFEINTPNGVASVRGTDFGVIFNEQTGKSDILVFKGLVALLDKAKSIQPVLVEAGKMASLVGEGIASEVVDIPETVKEEFMKNMEVKTKTAVNEEKTAEEEKTEEETKQEAKTEETKTQKTEKVPEEKQEEAKKTVEKKAKSAFEKWIEKYLKIFGDFGTIVLPDPENPGQQKIYSTFTINTEFTFGNIGIGVYAPIIFDPARGGLFEPENWYNYEEYNLKFDDFDSTLKSINDILIKIKYFRINHHDDPFYLKIGNIDDFVIGNGMNMYNYSNMLSFPETRYIGLQLKGEFGVFVFDLMADNVVDPKIVGLRPGIKLSKSFPLQIGVEFVGDITAISEDETSINPVIGAAGAGLILPIIPNNDILTIFAFADASTNFYWYSNSLPSDLQTNNIKAMGILPGFGAFAGLRGNILFIKYRFEYRYLAGEYIPQMFGPTYEMERESYYTYFLNTLKSFDSENFNIEELMDNALSGLYFGAQFSIIRNLIHGEASYVHYFVDPDQGSEVVGDTLKASIVLEDGLIDKVSGDISIIRPNWDVTQIINGTEGFFESFLKELVMDANLGYEVDKGIKFIVNYHIFYIYNETTGEYEQQMSYAVYTQLSF